MPITPGLFDITDKAQWDWIVDDHAPDKDFISDGESVCTISAYLFDYTLLQDAAAKCIGWSYVDEDTLKVKRFLPLFHPRWPWLWCTKINVSGEGFAGEIESEYSDSPNVPIYDKYRFDLTFEQLPYLVLPDTQVSNEFERFTTTDAADEGETIAIKQGQMLLVSTDPNINGRPYSGHTLRVYAQRTGLVVTVHKLPYDLIFNEFNVPATLMAARGKVSNSTFLGLEGNTILFKGWRTVKKTQVVSTFAFDEQAFGVNLELHFSYTNPARADGVGETHRGWNLVPGFNGAPQPGWYYTETQNGDPLYDNYDLNKLVQHWSLA